MIQTETIDFGTGPIVIEDIDESIDVDPAIADKLFVCALYGDWLEWTDEIYSFLIDEHKRAGRTLEESEVYELIREHPQFRAAIRNPPFGISRTDADSILEEKFAPPSEIDHA